MRKSKPLTKAYQYWFVLQLECNRMRLFTCVQLIPNMCGRAAERDFLFLELKSGPRWKRECIIPHLSILNMTKFIKLVLWYGHHPINKTTTHHERSALRRQSSISFPEPNPACSWEMWLIITKSPQAVLLLQPFKSCAIFLR